MMWSISDRHAGNRIPLGIMDDLKEYCSDFHYDLKTILSSPFTLVTPNSKNPYKQMYVAN